VKVGDLIKCRPPWTRNTVQVVIVAQPWAEQREDVDTGTEDETMILTEVLVDGVVATFDTDYIEVISEGG